MHRLPQPDDAPSADDANSHPPPSDGPLHTVIFDVAPIGVYAVDAQGRPLYNNATCRALYELGDAFSADVDWLGKVHPDDLPRVAQSWKEGFERRKPTVCEFRIVHTCGRVLHVLGRSQPVLDPQGRLTAVVGTIDDQTERRQTEQALEEERSYLSTLLKVTGAGIWRLDLHTQVLHMSAQCFSMLGREKEQGPLNAERMMSLVHPDDRQMLHQSMQQHVEGVLPVHECEFRMRHADGHWVWIFGRARIERSQDGAAPQWLYGTQFDISERRRQSAELRRHQDLLARTGAIAKVGGWIKQHGEDTLFLSDEACRMFGFPPGYRPTPQEIEAQRPESARQAIRVALEDAEQHGQTIDLELPLTAHDGSTRWHRIVSQPEFQDGRFLRHVGVTMDVTDSVTQRRALEAAHARVALATASGGIGIWSWGVGSDACEMDEHMRTMLGLHGSGQAVDQANWLALVHPEDRTGFVAAITACADTGEHLALELRILRGDGQTAYLRMTASVRRHADGAAQALDGVAWDVTKLRELSAQLTHRASHDALTGLLNRSEFMNRLEQALRQASADAAATSLLFIDLDQFKLEVAQLFGECIRKADTLARLGGDEFAILLAGCDLAHAIPAAQKICDRLESFRFLHEGRTFRVGASIGVAPVDAHWPDPSSVMQAADACCYAAKDAGRNRAHAWAETDQALRTRRGETDWATRLSQALDEQRFVLHAQRIAGMSGKGPGVHAEVLIRLRGNDGQLIAPGVFLGAAERFGLASRIDRWVLEEVLNHLDRLQTQDGLATIDTLCVNLSGQSFGDANFHRMAQALLVNAGPQVCQRLCMEITETAAITHLAEAARFIDGMRSLGVRVALDDFGAGASSFGYLRSLNVDVLKIDGQFVRHLLDDPINDVAVRCFVDLARVKNMKTVAEFVDSAAVLTRLGELQVDYAQGYLLHKPQPLVEVIGQVGV